MTERLTTGLDPLDRRIGGGLLPGSLVTLAAPPESQSEPLLHALMRDRPALYVSTTRRATVVEAALARALGVDGDYEIVHVGVDDPLDALRDRVRIDSEGSVVVVDSVGPIERGADETAYVTFLNDLKTELLETNSVAVLHAVEADDHPRLRARTLALSDVVMQLVLETSGERIENYLAIPKLRGEEPPEERIKLELGDGVGIDTSRDIA